MSKMVGTTQFNNERLAEEMPIFKKVKISIKMKGNKGCLKSYYPPLLKLCPSSLINYIFYEFKTYWGFVNNY